MTDIQANDKPYDKFHLKPTDIQANDNHTYNLKSAQRLYVHSNHPQKTPIYRRMTTIRTTLNA